MNSKKLLDLIGNTPLVEMTRLNPNPGVRLFVKLEKFNPGGSVKDRIAKYMIEEAEKSGQPYGGQDCHRTNERKHGHRLSVGLPRKGYDLVLVMPETMTLERRQILISLGAQILLSDGAKGMDGAEDMAHEIVHRNPAKYFMPNQFANEANVLAHYQTTGEEIWRDTDGQVTHFVGGIGTTGTLMGVSKCLKEHNPAVKIVGVQPEKGMAIQGLKDLKTQYVPAIWNPKLVDEIRYVNPKDAEDASRLLALQEGIFVGPSSGAIFHVAAAKAKEIDKGVVVAIAPDGGEKYLSTTLCDPILCLDCVKKYGIQCSYKNGRPIMKGDVSP